MKSNFRKFRGTVLLVFAIAALPALSHATSIDPSTIATGNFVSGTITGSPVGGGMVTLSITGSLASMTITTGTLSEIVPGLLLFTGGSLTVKNAQGIFHDILTNGTILSTGTGSFGISASLVPTAALITGSTSFSYTITNGVIVAGGGTVNFTGQLTPIPEPGTLGLFGTGLIGFAGLVRRKLKNGGASRVWHS